MPLEQPHRAGQSRGHDEITRADGGGHNASKPGTYALVLQSHRETSVQVGRWGRLHIDPGFYIYVGSAFGPGGVKARISRHFRSAKSKHWHIDYLRERVEPVLAWYRHGPTSLEHCWAQALPGMTGATPVRGFGCTDCRCHTHLFVFNTKPTWARFIRAVGSSVNTWIYQSADGNLIP